LAAADPHLEPPRSVRSTGDAPQFVAVASDRLAAAVAEQADDEQRQVTPGTVAVICTRSLMNCLAHALRDARVDFGVAPRQGLDQPVTLVPVDVVKGIEFDSVVVVEPARLVSAASR